MLAEVDDPGTTVMSSRAVFNRKNAEGKATTDQGAHSMHNFQRQRD
jgi:hypothetical protein